MQTEGVRMDRAADIQQKVLEFYKELPFNFGDVAEATRVVQSNPIREYTPLTALLNSSMRVLEVGCGVGWLANTMAYQYKAKVTAIDFNPVAIEQGMQVASALQLDVNYESCDLFRYTPETKFDVVVSLGVLHHTHDCIGALRHVCRDMVRPGGHIFIGLYHKYGRKPFLEHFAALIAAGASEDDLFDEYRKLHTGITDNLRLKSWMRDQVIHPHETQHTQEELAIPLREESMVLRATSLNGFAPITDLSEVYALEAAYEQRARMYLEQSRYFPGFFVFLAQKGEDSA